MERPPRRARGPRVLLVEDLGALGSDVTDLEERMAALRAAGASVSGAVTGAPPAGVFEDELCTIRSGAELREVLRAWRPDLVLVASAWPGGGPIGATVPRARPALWWPTGFGARGWGAVLGSLGAPRSGGWLPALTSHRPGADSEPAGLAWSTVEAERATRRRFPLWDGDYVLVPGDLKGPEGAAAMAAFAAIAPKWIGLDLVVWSAPSPEVTRRARSLGVAMRVHHVGPPPRQAEWAWWSQASGAILTRAVSLSGGLVLRGLASGCPLLALTTASPLRALARWLAEGGCAFSQGLEARGAARALARLLEGGRDVERSVRAGQRLAVRHDRETLVSRLAPLMEEFRVARTAA